MCYVPTAAFINPSFLSLFKIWKYPKILVTEIGAWGTTSIIPDSRAAPEEDAEVPPIAFMHLAPCPACMWTRSRWEKPRAGRVCSPTSGSAWLQARVLQVLCARWGFLFKLAGSVIHPAQMHDYVHISEFLQDLHQGSILLKRAGGVFWEFLLFKKLTRMIPAVEEKTAFRARFPVLGQIWDFSIINGHNLLKEPAGWLLWHQSHQRLSPLPAYHSGSTRLWVLPPQATVPPASACLPPHAFTLQG